MRRIHALGLGLAGVVALVACGDDGGTGGGGTGASGTGGSTSSSTTSSSSASSGGAGQGGAAQGGGGAAQGGGGAAQGGGGAGGGAAASVWAHAASGAGEEAVYEVETAADGGVLVLGYTTGTSDWGGGNVTSAGGTDIVLTKYSADGAHVFTKRFGGTGNDFGRKLEVGPSGEIFITGAVGGNVDFGGGTLTVGGFSDAFLLKLDSDGNHQWSKVLGSASSSDVAFAVAVNVDGSVVITGSFSGTVDFGGGNVSATNAVDGFVSAYDTDGAQLFTTPFTAGTAPTSYGVALDDLGNTYVSGAFTGTLSFGGRVSAGQEDVFLVKLDDTGALVWSKSFGGAGQEFGMNLVLDSNGDLVQSGNLTGSADFGGGVLTTAGNADVFVARFDTDGAHLSSVRFGDADDQFVADLEAGANGEVLVGGWFGGTFSVGTVALASTSSLQDGFWFVLDDANAGVDGTAYVNGPGSTQLRGVDFAPDAGVYFGGDFGLDLSVEGVSLTSGASDYYNGYWARASLLD